MLVHINEDERTAMRKTSKESTNNPQRQNTFSSWHLTFTTKQQAMEMDQTEFPTQSLKLDTTPETPFYSKYYW